MELGLDAWLLFKFLEIFQMQGLSGLTKAFWSQFMHFFSIKNAYFTSKIGM